MIYRPEIVGKTWFNSKPLTEKDLQDKIVLIDFWTYSCVNCIRTLPFLKQWWERYQSSDFVIIGIHTPEFEFEKDPINVEHAVQKLDIPWPVVLDNEYTNWSAFANKYWPAKYLCNHDKKIVYEHFGEGAYERTEQEIKKLLNKKGITEHEWDEQEHFHGKVCFTPTPELYCGYKRGVISNEEGYVDDQIADYARPEPMQKDTVGMEGKMLATEEYIETVDQTSALHVQFRATEVNIVLEPVEGHSLVEVTYNGLPLERDEAGLDVSELSEVSITEPKMFSVLKNKERSEGILSIKPISGNFRAYAYTFSGCEE